MTPNTRKDDVPPERDQPNDAQELPESSMTALPSPKIGRPHSTTMGNDSQHQAMIAPIIDAQVAFIQQWLTADSRQKQLSLDFWQWLGSQPLSRYLVADDIIHLINQWLLAQPMSEVLRRDIRAILHTIVFHPANDNVPLSELVDESQVAALAQYIASHESQRDTFIHTLIGNDAFADMLTQTLYHAIDDFMNSTLDKAGGVGKLMKFGRSSFEKATNNNLDTKLQAYLHRNIKDLSHKAETSAQAHLSNDEVVKLVEMGWSRIKDLPVSKVQDYLYSDASQSISEDSDLAQSLAPSNDSTASAANSTLNQLETGLQTSYNRLRISPYIHNLVSAGVETWFKLHSDDAIAEIAASIHIDSQVIEALIPNLTVLINDIAHSSWFEHEVRQLLNGFYAQPQIQKHLTGYQSL